MIQVQLEEFLVTVDTETAQQLKDASFASQYVSELRQKFQSSAEPSLIWTSAKRPTKKDHEATLAFLALRKQFDEAFNDPKKVNNDIWSQIAQQMNEMGYYVGTDMRAREKCRQKWSNLQTTYTKYKDKVKTTGEGYIKTPAYFEEIEQILGDKHKVNPVLVVDSLDEEEGVRKEAAYVAKEDDRSEIESTSSFEGVNRFNTIKKKIKPQSSRNSALDALVTILKENQATRKNEFDTIIRVMSEESRQRHEEQMALIRSLNKGKMKKRKHSSSDDSE